MGNCGTCEYWGGSRCCDSMHNNPHYYNGDRMSANNSCEYWAEKSYMSTTEDEVERYIKEERRKDAVKAHEAHEKREREERIKREQREREDRERKEREEWLKTEQGKEWLEKLPERIPELKKLRERTAKYQGCIAAGPYYTVGLKTDGTVVAVGNDQYNQCNISGWRDIVAVSTGPHTVGLKADGTIVGVYDASGWRDIVAVSAGSSRTVGLKADGTVVADGVSFDFQYDASGWRDIVAVSTGHHTVGLKADGTVVATGNDNKGQRNVNGWRDIVAVATGFYHTVGLKADGTVVETGNNEGRWDVVGWRDIVAIFIG